MNPGRNVLEEWDFVVEAGKIREFALAVKDIHSHRTDLAPPTFPVVVSAEFVERLVSDILGLDRSRTVHGEQEYEFFEPMKAGDRLRSSARIVDDEVKAGRRGGSMRVIKTAIEHICEETDRLICRETMTTIEMARPKP